MDEFRYDDNGNPVYSKNMGRELLSKDEWEILYLEYSKKRDIKEAILHGMNKLPEHLQDRWFDGSRMITGSNWIEEASKHIHIPFPEVW